MSEVDPKIIDRIAGFLAFYNEHFPPSGVPNPDVNPKSSAFREAVVMLYTIYLTDPVTYKEPILKILDEFDAAHGLVLLSGRLE